MAWTGRLLQGPTPAAVAAPPLSNVPARRAHNRYSDQSATLATPEEACYNLVAPRAASSNMRWPREQVGEAWTPDAMLTKKLQVSSRQGDRGG